MRLAVRDEMPLLAAAITWLYLALCVIYKLTCCSEMCLPDTAPPCGLLCRTVSDQLDKLIVARPDKIIVAQ